MKKTISIILAIMMVATLSVSAFALTAEELGALDAVNVYGKYIADSDPGETYVIDVTYGEMKFTYTQTFGEWDANANEYPATYEWASTSNTITVVNKSSTDVNVSAAFAAKDGFDVSGTVAFDDAALAWNETGVGTLTVTGEIDNAEEAVIGTVVVTLA